MEILVGTYAVVAVLLFGSGMIMYLDHRTFAEKRAGARKILGAPVWPIVAAVMLVIGTVRFIVQLVKDAR